MFTAIIGGGLQGIEAAYLSLKAGRQVMIIDKNPLAPAARLGHIFLREDVTKREDLFRLLPGVDLVIPALENDAAIAAIIDGCQAGDMPLAFDGAAYALSASKIESDELFARLGIPAPLPWPRAKFPLIAKPSESSGSRGVKIIRSRAELEAVFPGPGAAKDWVLQEYIKGPSYSLEVVGVPGFYRALQVTDLEMDAVFDCKRVTAPTRLAPELCERFVEISLQIAAAISLKGIMDVEVILHEGQLKVLEIDARLPSQTPVTVFWSTGINMVEMLGDLAAQGNTTDSSNKTQSKVFAGVQGAVFSKSAPCSPKAKKNKIANPRGVVLEHIKVSGNTLQVCGERIMKDAGTLCIQPGFFGADEAIGDYAEGKRDWVATLIVSGADCEEAWNKRNAVIKNIKQHIK
ncbi:MAG: 3-methylornithine--L-lysine ligase PylC [Candidatus Aminicenantes bacterium]|nr:3-methylornithine--L-lysine ligase PylC [Candidatus Aminicenantes bacterium]